MRTKWRDGYVEWTGLVLREPEMCCTLITALTNQAVITGILPVACNCPILLFESHQDFNSWRAVPASQKGIAWPPHCLGWKLCVTTGVGVPPAVPWVPGGGTPCRCPAAPSPAGRAGSEPSSPAPAPPLRLQHLTGQSPPGPSEEGAFGLQAPGVPCPLTGHPPWLAHGWTRGPGGAGLSTVPPKPTRARPGWKGRPVWLLSGVGTGMEIMFWGIVWGVSLQEHGTSLCSRGQSRPQRGHLP